jgi:hypothetical protein
MRHEHIIKSWCIIRKDYVILNDKIEPVQENNLNFTDLIKSLFKKEQLSYPKFYKMDNLSKLGFLCSELVLRNCQVAGRYRKDEIGIVIANMSASLDTDMNYQESINDKANYFPSPSVFVYTLPNLVIGEICIRHKINGENAFIVMENFDASVIKSLVDEQLGLDRTSACLCGWVEVLKNRFEAVMFFVEKPGIIDGTAERERAGEPFTVEKLNEIFKKQG